MHGRVEQREETYTRVTVDRSRHAVRNAIEQVLEAYDHVARFHSSEYLISGRSYPTIASQGYVFTIFLGDTHDNRIEIELDTRPRATNGIYAVNYTAKFHRWLLARIRRGLGTDSVDRRPRKAVADKGAVDERTPSERRALAATGLLSGSILATIVVGFFTSYLALRTAGLVTLAFSPMSLFVRLLFPMYYQSASPEG
jgi:hypothetical protein